MIKKNVSTIHLPTQSGNSCRAVATSLVLHLLLVALTFSYAITPRPPGLGLPANVSQPMHILGAIAIATQGESGKLTEAPCTLAPPANAANSGELAAASRTAQVKPETKGPHLTRKETPLPQKNKTLSTRKASEAPTKPPPIGTMEKTKDSARRAASGEAKVKRTKQLAVTAKPSGAATGKASSQSGNGSAVGSAGSGSRTGNAIHVKTAGGIEGGSGGKSGKNDKKGTGGNGPAQGFAYALHAVDIKPKVLSRVQVTYPEEARRQRVSGKVTLRFHLSEQGRVSRMQVISATPPGVFDENAMKAVRQWRFSPAKKDGRPVPVWVELPMPFVLR